jgi:hypothetical protein
VGVSGGSCSSVSSAPSPSGPSNTVPYSAITGRTSAVLEPRPSSTDWPPQPVQAGIASNCEDVFPWVCFALLLTVL